jgi:hypothetical protein
METVADDPLRITALPFLGEHGDLDIQAKTTYLVEALGRKFFFAVDSANLDVTLFSRIGSILDGVDMLFLGMECEGAPVTWGYGALFTKALDARAVQTRRDRASNCEQGLAMVRAVRPGRVVVYAMGQEPWLSHVMGINQSPDTLPARESARFIESARSAGYPAEKPHGKAEYVFHGNS